MEKSEKSEKSEKKNKNMNDFPMIGLGTSGMDSLEDLVNVVKMAIENGYRAIDTASLYQTEEGIGIAIEECVKSGLVTRKELWVTSKMWITESNEPEEALMRSLKKLKLDYIDLYLIHWPLANCHIIDTNNENNNQAQKDRVLSYTPLHKLWPIFESFVKRGLVRHIGVSNFNCQLLVDLLSYAEIRPFCNQIEIHPYLNQRNLVNFLKKNKIIPIAYCPLFKYGKDDKHALLDEKIIVDLATKHNKTPAQIVLNWHLHNGVAVIPKSNNKERQKENLNSSSFKMDEEDYALIDTLNCNKRRCGSMGPAWSVGFDIFS